LNPIGPGASRFSRARKRVLSWAARVEAAPSAHDVVEVARDFLAQLTPYEVHALPDPCKPPRKLVDADDVTAYALALVQHDCAQGSDEAELAHKMADFFSHASGRLARLASEPPAFRLS
jgi:hypothetical protein